MSTEKRYTGNSFDNLVTEASNLPRSQSASCNADLTSAMGAPVCSRNCLMRAILLGAAAKHRNPSSSVDDERWDKSDNCWGLMPLSAFTPSIGLQTGLISIDNVGVVAEWGSLAQLDVLLLMCLMLTNNDFRQRTLDFSSNLQKLLKLFQQQSS